MCGWVNVCMCECMSLFIYYPEVQFQLLRRFFIHVYKDTSSALFFCFLCLAIAQLFQKTIPLPWGPGFSKMSSYYDSASCFRISLFAFIAPTIIKKILLQNLEMCNLFYCLVSWRPCLPWPHHICHYLFIYLCFYSMTFILPKIIVF